MPTLKKDLEILLGDSESFTVKIRTKNPGGQSIPFDLTDKTLTFIVKESEISSEQYITKTNSDGILMTDEINGEAEITLSGTDTESLRPYPTSLFWLLKLEYGEISKTLMSGILKAK